MKFDLGKDPRTPQVLVTLSDGTRLTATYNTLAKTRRVTVTTDALPAEIAKAAALMTQSKHADARKLLQDAIKKYPASPEVAEARKLIQQTFATASAVPVRPPIVTPRPDPTHPSPGPAHPNPGPAVAAVTPKPAPVVIAPRPPFNPNLPPLMVVSARYGAGTHWANITDSVREMVKGGTLALPQNFSAAVGVDPLPGFLKSIDLIVIVDGVPMRIFTAENETAPPFMIASERAP
jgi:hypothetical protein